jgi:hypothetical protein
MLLALTPLNARGQQEGINVRGDWVLEVVNADGSLASRRAFQNAFNGADTLGQILSRRVTPAGWAVVLHLVDLRFGEFRVLAYTERGTPIESHGDGLLSEVTCCSPLTFKASYNNTDSRTWHVEHVTTTLRTCDAGGACSGGNGVWPSFTGTVVRENGVRTPLALQPDQTVRVTVTLTFSSALHPPEQH